jgi:hypothetical protein
VQISTQEDSREVFSYFLSFISFSIHFRILNKFLEFIFKNQNPRKGMNISGPESGPWPRYAGPAQRGKAGQPARASGVVLWRVSHRRDGGRSVVRFSQ